MNVSGIDQSGNALINTITFSQGLSEQKLDLVANSFITMHVLKSGSTGSCTTGLSEISNTQKLHLITLLPIEYISQDIS